MSTEGDEGDRHSSLHLVELMGETMRSLCKLLILGCSFGLTTAWGEPSSHLRIDAREIATAVSSNDLWTTSWGGPATTGNKAVQVSVRNLGSSPAVAQVLICFLCDGAEMGRAEKEFKLQNQLEVRATIVAPTSSLNRKATGYRSTEVNRPVSSWYVVGKSDGRIFGCKASSTATQVELEKLIRSGAFKWN